MSDEQGAFVFELPATEAGAATSQPEPRRELSPQMRYELTMLKLLGHFGSTEAVRANLTERGKLDPSWRAFLDDFIRWNG